MYTNHYTTDAVYFINNVIYPVKYSLLKVELEITV
jgi:hypothetical protein